MKRLATILALTLLAITLTTAANPGHTAASISPGTFNGGAAGTFSFPGEVNIGGNFIVNSNNFFINTTSGNVGIGTTNPTSRLYVEGSITVNSTSDICIEGGICLSEAGTGSGDVGGNGTINTIPLWSGTATLSNSLITQNSNTINISGGLEINDTNFIVDTDKLVVSSTGRVGIGTTNPQTALEVDGGIRLNPSTGRPDCEDSSQRGTMWYEASSGGVDDFLYSCMRNSSGGYNWILVARGG